MVKVTKELKYGYTLDLVNSLDDKITEIIPDFANFGKGFYASDIHKSLAKRGKVGGAELTYNLLQKRVAECQLTYDKESNTFRLWTLPIAGKPPVKETKTTCDLSPIDRDIKYINARLAVLNAEAVAAVRKLVEDFMLGSDANIEE
jgi:hypothetical protein